MRGPRRGAVPTAGTTLVLLLALLVVAPQTHARKGEPEVITVQHILIGFKGSVRGKDVSRSKKEAKTLAYEILDRVDDGEAFDGLVKEYTDDKYPGIYTMTNTDALIKPNTFKRSEMAVSFGDVAFRLKVGEVGIAKWHTDLCPFGYHIIKRLE